MPSKDDVARKLAELHFEIEPDLSKGRSDRFGQRGGSGRAHQLLEVTSSTFATGSVEAFAFPVTASVPYQTVIAEVTPEEYARIQKNEIPLPKGWSLTNAKLFERPRAA